MDKPNNRLPGMTKDEAEAIAADSPGAPADRIGGLTDEDVQTLLRVMPKEAWFLVSNLFYGGSTTFSAQLVKPAGTVQSFVTELLQHPTFVASA